MGLESRNMSVADVANEYLDDFINVDAPKTRESRIHHLNKYIVPELGHLEARNVTRQHVRWFYSRVESEKSHKKVKEIHRHINKMIEWAIDNQREFSKSPTTKDVIKRIRRIAKAARRFDGTQLYLTTSVVREIASVDVTK